MPGLGLWFVQYSVRGRGAEGGEGEGGRGGGGEGGGQGGEGGGGFWCSPPTDSPNPLEEAKLHRRTLGAHFWVHTEAPPPPTRGGGQWGGD